MPVIPYAVGDTTILKDKKVKNRDKVVGTKLTTEYHGFDHI